MLSYGDDVAITVFPNNLVLGLIVGLVVVVIAIPILRNRQALWHHVENLKAESNRPRTRY